MILIASTWSFSPLREDDDGAERFVDIVEEIQGKVRWYFAVVLWRLDNLSGKGMRTEEMVSVLLWTLTLPSTSCISEQFRNIQQVTSLILHCKTMCCCKRTSPSTSCHVGNISEIHSNNQKWIDPRRKKSPKKQAVRVFSLQWTRWTMIKAWKKVDATWTSQGSHHTEILGDLIKIHCIGAIGSSLRREELQFCQTRSHAIVLYNTLPVICIETAACMKTKEALHYNRYQSPKLPRVILKPNSQSKHLSDSERGSQNSLYQKKHFQQDICGPGWD